MLNINAQVYASAIVSSDWASAQLDRFRDLQSKTVGSAMAIQGDCVAGHAIYEVDVEFINWRVLATVLDETFGYDGKGLDDWSEWEMMNESIPLSDETITVRFRRHIPVSVQMIGLNEIAATLKF